MKKNSSIAVVGVGGQGTVLASDILIDGLLELGYDVKKTEQHGLSQRGGTVNCLIKYGEKVYAPVVSDNEADLVLAFEKLESARWLSKLAKGGHVVVNDFEIHPVPVKMGKEKYPENIFEALKENIDNLHVIEATKLAEQIGTSRVQSIIMLGAAVKILKLDIHDWKSIISKKVPQKFVEQNLQAFELGLKSV
ncbi:indolepyruvate oxidoreductase subunit beta [Anaerotignum sp.]|uniref:indolepyruvate oxidoreductase subunit beta n=1 Tax=Anaerotignum sp. TaxID=2039241 RepID=UPI002715023E|nr:indolepyruvate oxidoreductase subunit beta [Anaerotignum sp.]